MSLVNRHFFAFLLIAVCLGGCKSPPMESAPTPLPTRVELTRISPTNSPIPDLSGKQLYPGSNLSDFAFPESPDPAQRYLFYLHGKIIEDQGIPAISPIYGKYEYLAILERLSSYGYKVISEPRPINADVEEYARITIRQVSALLEAGVPANNITVVGASKGAYIVMLVSHILANESANFVLLAICHPEVVTNFIQDQNTLSGNILSIYDSSDEYAGSCQELFSFSEGRGITRSEEIILDINNGHGLLYSPLDEWVLPTVQWANKQAD